MTLKKLCPALIGGALALALSGCELSGALPYAREIDHIALMRTIGVDAAGADIAVTVSSGVQSKGANKGEQPPLVLSQKAGTISGALLSMQADGASYIFYGHVGQLLLGEELARRDAATALDYVLRDIEMRLDTNLFLVKGDTASAAIRGASSGDQSATERLDAMEEDAGLVSHSAPQTVGEVLEDLAGRGSAYAPALSVSGEGGPRLTASGYGIIKGGTLAAWTNDDESRGLNLIQGNVDADVVELYLPNGSLAALRVVGAKTTVSPVFQANRLTGLKIHCKVDANLAEEPSGLDLREEQNLLYMEESLAGAEGVRVRAALTLAQQLDADFLGMKKRAGLAAPWRWDEIQAQWDLPALDLALTVEAKIQRSYDVDR